MDLASNIKKYRELRGLSLPELARRAEVSKAFLWEMESGNAKRPGAETLFRIAAALGVTMAHLMGKEPAVSAVPGIEPEVNEGLRAFINERRRQGQPLEADEIHSLSLVQLKGGRPQTKEQWALVYGMLKQVTESGDS